MSGDSLRLSALWLALVVIVYLFVGSLFAVYTPAWQAPDEPAHYNYVRYLAEQKRFPVLQSGDYPHDYVREIVSEDFPPNLSIAPFRYEFYQPPLYYLLVTPVFGLFDGALLPLRLLSVILGAGLIYVAYQLVLTVWPGQPALALGAAAFVAFVPMHVATTAAVNNDTLAELLLALALWGLMRYVRGQGQARRTLLGVGLLLGLGLLTKIYALMGLAVGVTAVVGHRWRDGRRMALELTWLLAPALALALPWWGRNVAVYGWPDVMGLARHDAVVLGQPTTAEWIADYGWGHVLREGLRTTYRSFWGQFGWMAVPMDGRVYLALGFFVAVVMVGLAGVAVRRKNPGARLPLPAVLLWLVVALAGCSYVWYNTKFVQHQGRYLFPALVPLGLAVALGWQTALRWGIRGSRRTCPEPGRRGVEAVLFALPYVGLATLDVVSLFAFVVPYLTTG